MIPQPKVSVLIPCYNYAHYLDDAIPSVLAQTFTDFELIIVDNKSTDNTVEVIKKYLHDKRVRFYQNETNIGLVGNWNRSLDYARGEYIKILCADDKLHPQMLEKFVPVMQQYPNVSIVSSYNKWFGSREEGRRTPFQGLVNGEYAKRNMIGTRNWLFAPTANMFRKDSLKVGKFNPQLHQTIDWEFYLRLLSVGDCYIVPEFLSYTRVHTESVSANRLKTREKRYRNTLEMYRFISVVRSLNKGADKEFQTLVNAKAKEQAVECAAIVYKVLPEIYKKVNRELFKESFKIGIAEGVHLKSLLLSFSKENLNKFFGKTLKSNHTFLIKTKSTL